MPSPTLTTVEPPAANAAPAALRTAAPNDDMPQLSPAGVAEPPSRADPTALATAAAQLAASAALMELDPGSPEAVALRSVLHLLDSATRTSTLPALQPEPLTMPEPELDQDYVDGISCFFTPVAVLFNVTRYNAFPNITPRPMLEQDATSPSVDRLVVISREMPWRVPVRAASGGNVRVVDVLWAMHNAGSCPLSEAEYNLLDSSNRSRVQDNHAARGVGGPFLRLDLLGERCFLGGLVRDERFVQDFCGQRRIQELVLVAEFVTENDARAIANGSTRPA